MYYYDIVIFHSNYYITLILFVLFVISFYFFYDHHCIRTKMVVQCLFRSLMSSINALMPSTVCSYHMTSSTWSCPMASPYRCVFPMRYAVTRLVCCMQGCRDISRYTIYRDIFYISRYAIYRDIFFGVSRYFWGVFMIKTCAEIDGKAR